MSVVVVYHYPCPDGGMAALAAALHFGAGGARFVPLRVTAKAPEKEALADSFSGASVFLCDISGGPEFITRACRQAASVVLLDHHKTAAEDVAAMDAAGARPANLDVQLDMARSGARIAFDFFAARAPLSPVTAGIVGEWDDAQEAGAWRC